MKWCGRRDLNPHLVPERNDINCLHSIFARCSSVVRMNMSKPAGKVKALNVEKRRDLER